MFSLLRTSTLLVLLGFTAKAIAQSSTISHLSSTTTKEPPQTHTVTVGKASFAYSPDTIEAQPGDLVVFQFFPSNHSVIRAEYGYPCVPYEDVAGPDAVGFFSGHPVTDGLSVDPPTWNLTVNDTEPVFFYCSAPTSCINHQMVGVINPNTTQVLDKQKALAASSDYMLEPGQPFPDEEASSMSVIAATATISSEPGAATTTASGAPLAVTSDHSGLSGGAIAGIVIGGVAVLLLAAALFFFIGRNATLKQALAFRNHHQHPEAARSSLPPPPPPAKDMTYGHEHGFAPMDPYKSDPHRHIPSYSAPPYSVTPSNAPESMTTTAVAAEELDSVTSGGSPRMSPRSFGPGPRYTPGTEFGTFISDPRVSQRNSQLGPHEMEGS